MINIQELPAEMLENIFANFLPNVNDNSSEKKGQIKELIKCTEVCKLFNEVIGRSERLMSGIILRWESDESKDPEPILRTSRLYKNLVVCGKTRPTLILAHFLESQPKIAYLRICIDFGSKLWTFELRTIIDLVKNSLRELYVDSGDLKHSSTLEPINVPNLRVLDLGYSYDKEMENIFSLFVNPEKLEEFSFDRCPEVNCTKLESFLLGCGRLKKLNLGDSLAGEMFNTSDLAEQANFQLENLALDSFYGDSTQLSKFSIFIKRQSCLKKLKLSCTTLNGEMLNAILNIKSLKDFFTDTSDLQNVHNIHARSSSIEILTLSMSEAYDPENLELLTGIYEIIKGCPAVKKLIFDDIDFTAQIVDHLVKYSKQLKVLDIDLFGDVHPASVPTIHTLTVNAEEVDDFNDKAGNVLELVKLNPQLKKIRIHNFFEEYEFLRDLKILAGEKLEFYK